jgi:hypothetical protein
MDGFKQTGFYEDPNTGQVLPLYKKNVQPPVRPTMAYGAGPSTGNKRRPPTDDKPRKQAKSGPFKGVEVRPASFCLNKYRNKKIRFVENLGIVKIYLFKLRFAARAPGGLRQPVEQDRLVLRGRTRR